MRRTSIVAAVLGSLFVASSSFAGFTVTATKVVSGGFDRYDIVAVNTGGDTGTQIKGLEYSYSGAGVAFEVADADEDGTPDTVNFNSASRSRIRINNAATNNTYVGQTPPSSETQPNAYSNPIGAFSGAIANTGTTQASGTGYQIARLFLPTGGTGVFSGNLGGDVGSKVPFSVTLSDGPGPTNVAPTIGANSGAAVNFGSIVSTPLPFSGTVVVTDADAGDTVALAVGTLPSNVSGVTVTPAGQNASGTVFTISGTIAYTGNGVTNLDIIASDNNSTSVDTTGVFAITVTPEPASLSALALGSLLMGRRRK